MSPIKSSLARSVAKLLGVSRDRDLSLRGTVQNFRSDKDLSVQASGGTEIVTPTAKFHVYMGDTEQNFSVTQGGLVEVLVVAGGGSGGYFYGAGGGAGGIVHAAEFPVETGQTYKISAGNGAGSRPNSQGYGNNGSNSYLKPGPAPAAASATNLFAMGGGGGGYSGDPDDVFPTPYKNSTGSSGGTVGPATPYAGRTPSFPSSTQHPSASKYSNGGAAGQENSNGGGGGGAGAAAGTNQDGGISNPASPGGAGRPFSNFPAPVIAPAIPGAAQPRWTSAVGPTGLFGGGGAGYKAPGTVPAAPGGGAGWYDPEASGNHDAVNYTGGGGAGPNPDTGTGGHGIVLVRYAVT